MKFFGDMMSATDVPYPEIYARSFPCVVLAMLDHFRIYNSDAYRLYACVCDNDVRKVHLIVPYQPP